MNWQIFKNYKKRQLDNKKGLENVGESLTKMDIGYSIVGYFVVYGRKLGFEDLRVSLTF